MTQQASGADLARQALAAARANAKNVPAPQPKTRPTLRTHRGERTEPQGLSGILGRLTAEQGWKDNLDGGSILDEWPTLCPQYVGLVQAVSYDDAARRLDLRPGSHSYAAQLRLLGGQLAKQINDKMGRPVVRAIRVLPVGNVDTARTAGPAPAAVESEAPVRTRETASPGYRETLGAHLAAKPAERTVSDDIRAAQARQDAALTAPQHREPTEHFTDGLAELERTATAPVVDRSDAVRRAALARKRQDQAGGGQLPRRAFDVA